MTDFDEEVVSHNRGSNLSNYDEFYEAWDYAQEVECPDCYGTGLDRDEIYECETCFGEGYLILDLPLTNPE